MLGKAKSVWSLPRISCSVQSASPGFLEIHVVGNCGGLTGANEFFFILLGLWSRIRCFLDANALEHWCLWNGCLAISVLHPILRQWGFSNNSIYIYNMNVGDLIKITVSEFQRQMLFLLSLNFQNKYNIFFFNIKTDIKRFPIWSGAAEGHEIFRIFI